MHYANLQIRGNVGDRNSGITSCMDVAATGVTERAVQSLKYSRISHVPVNGRKEAKAGVC